MSLLIVCIVVIVLLILVWMLVDSAPFGDQRLKWVLKALACLVAIIVIIQRSGLVSG
jgi:hypothetical protein